MKKQLMMSVCNRCGKEMPKDKERSNENWIVYEVKCHCGGESKLVFIDNKQKI